MSEDNLTHHLVPRSNVMRCAYCAKVNVDTAEQCPARIESRVTS